MSYRADKQVMTAHMDGQTNGRTQTDAGNDNNRRPKLASVNDHCSMTQVCIPVAASWLVPSSCTAICSRLVSSNVVLFGELGSLLIWSLIILVLIELMLALILSPPWWSRFIIGTACRRTYKLAHLTLKVKVNHPPKTIGILTKVFYTSKFGDPSLNGWWVIPGTNLVRDRLTDGQTQATIIPAGQYWPRVMIRENLRTWER